MRTLYKTFIRDLSGDHEQGIDLWVITAQEEDGSIVNYTYLDDGSEEKPEDFDLLKRHEATPEMIEFANA